MRCSASPHPLSLILLKATTGMAREREREQGRSEKKSKGKGGERGALLLGVSGTKRAWGGRVGIPAAWARQLTNPTPTMIGAIFQSRLPLGGAREEG